MCLASADAVFRCADMPAGADPGLASKGDSGGWEPAAGIVAGAFCSALKVVMTSHAGGTAMRVPVVTSEFKINYVRPAVGERLIARAHAVHHGKSQAVCRCDVFVLKDGAEKLCAVAQGTITALPQAPSV